MEASTSDLADAHGEGARVLAPGLRHYGGRRRFAGRIATVRCFEDNTHVKELVATPGEARVLLVDGGGSTRCALVGDLLAGEALTNGWAGIVVHGAVRDTAALGTLELGVMALGSSPRRSRKDGHGAVAVPVEICGVTCRPGEYLVADEDGVVVVDSALVGQ